MFVIMGSYSLSKDHITCGAPQGSVLGLTLFSIYVLSVRENTVSESGSAEDE